MAAKSVTSWKSKKVYHIISPENFEAKEVGTTLATDPSKLIGRTVKMSLGELMKDRSKNYMNMVFEISEVKGDKAHTRFKKFFIPVGYLRSKVRKKTFKLDFSQEIAFEGTRLNIKVMVLSRHSVSKEQQSQIKRIMVKCLEEDEETDAEKFIQQTLFGKVGTDIYKNIKTVCPIMRVEVYGIERIE
jgi:small subunit ribosomal protein S3Ae